MSLLIRRMQGNLGSWQRLLQDSTLEALRHSPPLWVIKDFLPTERDAGCISVFEVADEDEALLVASAFAFREKLEARQLYFSAAMQQIRSNAINVVSSNGNLDHDFADKQHREIVIGDLRDAAKIAGLFVTGTMMSFEGKSLLATAKASARQGQFNITKICARKPLSDNAGALHTARFIGEADIRAQGMEA